MIFPSQWAQKDGTKWYSLILISINLFRTMHYDDVTMGTIASQITNLTIVYSTLYSGADQSKHQRPASLAFVWGIHRGPVNSPHKWPVTRKMFPSGDVIMADWLQGHHICFNYNEDTLTIVDMTDKTWPTVISKTGYTGAMYTHQVRTRVLCTHIRYVHGSYVHVRYIHGAMYTSGTYTGSMYTHQVRTRELCTHQVRVRELCTYRYVHGSYVHIRCVYRSYIHIRYVHGAMCTPVRTWELCTHRYVHGSYVHTSGTYTGAMLTHRACAWELCTHHVRARELSTHIIYIHGSYIHIRYVAGSYVHTPGTRAELCTHRYVHGSYVNTLDTYTGAIYAHQVCTQELYTHIRHVHSICVHGRTRELCTYIRYVHGSYIRTLGTCTGAVYTHQVHTQELRTHIRYIHGSCVLTSGTYEWDHKIRYIGNHSRGFMWDSFTHSIMILQILRILQMRALLAACHERVGD